MNKFNTIEEFFSYAFTQAKTQEQRLAIYFVKEGYMLPKHLEKLTWKDVDLENNRFWSVNFLDKFLVPMSSEFREEIKTYSLHKEEYAPIFKEIDELHLLIQKLTIALDENPIILEQFNALFGELPLSHRNTYIPPAKLMNRISGNPSYKSFQHGGFLLAQIISKKLQQYGNHKEEHLLDWGCGCGRTGIHFIHNKSIKYTGCDIDKEAITWCNRHLGSHFHTIDIKPPTCFENEAFSSIVGISVMTHLDEKFQQIWLKEMHRLLKPDGLLLLSVHGDVAAKRDGLEKELTKNNFYDDLTDNALGDIAPENYYRSTFQTKAYTYENWTTHFDIIDYCEGEVLEHQDLVIMRKKDI